MQRATGRRWLTYAVAATAALAAWLALAGMASASTYCVQLSPCPQNGSNHATLQQALDAADAHSGVDTIDIGPVTLHDVSSFDASGNPVKIVGRGATRTVLVGDGPQGAADGVVRLHEPASSIEGLTVRVARGGDRGLYMRGATARQVAVTTAPQTSADIGVQCEQARSS
jgi:pectin methylesterase-like acyl-CoA thioesterase